MDQLQKQIVTRAGARPSPLTGKLAGPIWHIVSSPEAGLAVAAAVTFVFFTAVGQTMILPVNLNIIMTRSSFIGFAAVGMAVLMLVGEIDFSAGAAATLAGLVYNFLGGWGEPARLASAVLAAAVVGWLNSFLVLDVGLPSFLATLSTYFVVSGVSAFIPGSYRLGQPPFAFLGSPSPLFGMPWAFVLLLAVVVVGDILIRRTRLGPLLWATGANPRAAEATGIDTTLVKTLCFMFCSVCAAIGGLLVIATMNITPAYGDDWQVWVPAIAIIGGSSLRGGTGSLLGALLGTLLLLIIRTGLGAANLGNNAQGVVVGGILVAALVVDGIRRKLRKA
jgi:ribose transport system permease protein